jgi:hypothetical protein
MTELEKIVDQVYFLQQTADERFGGFHYGDNYVVRDFVAERKENENYKHPFSARYDVLTDDMQTAILEQVKCKFIEDSIQEYMDARNLSIVTITRS